MPRAAIRAVALLLFASRAACAALGPGLSAEVLDIQGTGQQHPANDTVWQLALVKQGLPGGAFVRTLEGSRMALLFADETQVRLNQNSILQVKEVAQAGSGQTVLRLEIGRAWAQAKNITTTLKLETPAATAAIRGTDWELEVDRSGKTTLVVLSGSVEYFNAQGSVTVDPNEAAVAEIGKAPVKILLTRPRDRILWVNAYRFEPLRFADAAKESPTVRDAIAAVERGNTPVAIAALETARKQGTRDVATYAMLAELEIVNGHFDAAATITKEALAIAPGDPDLLAQLVRAELLGDKVDEAKATLALPRNAETASILVAEGETARREGRAPEAITAFERATRVAPSDDRGWFALGRAQAEREDVVPARHNLQKALALQPDGAGYLGEQATLDTATNRFANADVAFAAALKANPGDYVALTGLGLLRLKEGDPAVALDALLRAGVMEPRFARAKTYTAVAYYQLGRHPEAIATLQQAAALDDLDPLPYIFLAQVYTDLFQAGDAVQAAREAKVRLPNLKSLNQIANNLRGTADVGYALAFFGLEDWALELAQESYNAFSASSHLFLADRYRGEFNKNSELFQGFLTDPTAFGGSNRFATLVPTAGNYRTLGYSYDKGDDRLSNPYIRLNGLFDFPRRSAYYLDAESGVGTTKTDSVDPDGKQGQVKGNLRAELYAGGFGSLLTDQFGIFAYGTKFRDTVSLRDFAGTTASQNQSRVDVGASYRFGPTSMTWVKFGRTNETISYDNYYIFNEDLTAADAASSAFSNRPSDIEARHTIDLSPTDHLAFGFEAADDARASSLLQARIITTPVGYLGLGLRVDQQAKLRSRQGYVSYVKDLLPTLALEADIFWQQFRQQITENRATIVTLGDESASDQQQFNGSAQTNQWNPRAGVVWKPDIYVVRAAWQRWTQPASVSTLAPVATAGIPLEDRLVSAGGTATRTHVELRAEPDSMTSLSAFYDNDKVRNLGQLGYRIPVPEVQFVELLRNAQLINVATDDLLEATPEFDSGRIEAAGVTVNRMVNKTLSFAVRYVYTQNTATIYERDDTGQIVSATDDARIPYVPRQLLALGMTWVSPLRIYFSARAVYRSERFTDRLNTPDAMLRADWNGAFAAFWETADKRLIIGAGATNLGSKSENERYTVDVRFRF